MMTAIDTIEFETVSFDKLLPVMEMNIIYSSQNFLPVVGCAELAKRIISDNALK